MKRIKQKVLIWQIFYKKLLKRKLITLNKKFIKMQKAKKIDLLYQMMNQKIWKNNKKNYNIISIIFTLNKINLFL